MSFASKWNTTFKFNVDTKDAEFITIQQLMEMTGGGKNTDGTDIIFPVLGVFINTESKFGEHPYVATVVNNKVYLLDLPKHLTAVCSAMREDTESVDIINNGHAGLIPYTYHSDLHNKDCYSVNWADM